MCRYFLTTFDQSHATRLTYFQSHLLPSWKLQNDVGSKYVFWDCAVKCPNCHIYEQKLWSLRRISITTRARHVQTEYRIMCNWDQIYAFYSTHVSFWTFKSRNFSDLDFKHGKRKISIKYIFVFKMFKNYFLMNNVDKTRVFTYACYTKTL